MTKASSLNQRLDDATETLHQLVDVLSRRRFTVAFVGEAGSGKSSLINRMVGAYVAPIGAIETTMSATEHDLPGSPLRLVDLPGYGTRPFPADRFVEELALSTYDFVLLIYSARVKEDDVAIFQKLRETPTSCYVVRNYMDVALEGEAAHHDKNAKNFNALLRDVEQDARIQFRVPTLRVYGVSAQPDAPTYDLPALEQDLHQAVRAYVLHQIRACIDDQLQPLAHASSWARTRFVTTLTARTIGLSIPYAHRTVGMMLGARALGVASSR